MNYELKLEAKEVEQILNVLAKESYSNVYQLISKIYSQTTQQENQKKED